MSDLLRYRRERLPAGLILTVGVLLSIAAAAVSGSYDGIGFGVNVCLAGLLVVQFRLWDDLADVRHDRVLFPDRLLCQLERYTGFWLVVAMLSGVTCVGVWRFKSPTAAMMLVALNAVFFVWYHGAREYLPRSFNTWFVLTKYPAFALLLADPQRLTEIKTSAIVWIVVVYAGACLYEILHNLRDSK